MKHTIQTPVSSDELSNIIDQHIIGFKAIRNRAILKPRYIDGLTYEELAELYAISVQQAKNIAYKGLNRILPYL